MSRSSPLSRSRFRILPVWLGLTLIAICLPFAAQSEESRIRGPQLHARSNYAWPYASGPHYGGVGAATRATPGLVRTRVGSFDLTQGTPDFPRELLASDKPDPRVHRSFILVLDPTLLDADGLDRLRDQITPFGGGVVEALGSSGCVVRLNATARDVVRVQPETLALERYHPAFKLSPWIGRTPIFAAGNVRSRGDIAILTYSQTSTLPSFQLLMNHDDDEREFAYSEKGNASLIAAKEGTGMSRV